MKKSMTPDEAEALLGGWTSGAAAARVPLSEAGSATIDAVADAERRDEERKRSARSPPKKKKAAVWIITKWVGV